MSKTTSVNKTLSREGSGRRSVFKTMVLLAVNANKSNEAISLYIQLTWYLKAVVSNALAENPI